MYLSISDLFVFSFYFLNFFTPVFVAVIIKQLCCFKTGVNLVVSVLGSTKGFICNSLITLGSRVLLFCIDIFLLDSRN